MRPSRRDATKVAQHFSAGLAFLERRVPEGRLIVKFRGATCRSEMDEKKNVLVAGFGADHAEALDAHERRSQYHSMSHRIRTCRSRAAVPVYRPLAKRRRFRIGQYVCACRKLRCTIRGSNRGGSRYSYRSSITDLFMKASVGMEIPQARALDARRMLH
jgi:hypothetical protein